MPKNKGKLGFTEAAAILKRLNTEFRRAQEWRDVPPPRRSHPLPFFTSIKLPFTPEEWCDLMMSEGRHYIGGCCANSSAVQDVLGRVFRFESGWMDGDTLAEMAMLQVSHGEGNERPNFKDLGNREAALKKWPCLDPWKKLAVLWHLIKDCHIPKVPSAPPPELPPVENAIDIVQTGLQALSIHRMFVTEETPDSQDRTERLVALYRLLPAIRTLHDMIGELNPGPFKGFALIDKEQGGKVAENGYGLCVYKTKAEAEKMLETWRADGAEDIWRGRGFTSTEERKSIDERIGIRPVRISAENGIEFLDEKNS